jgi:nucleotide-binding universal stress UspA family protein
MKLARPKETEVRVLHVIEPLPLYPDGQAWGYGSEASQVLEEQREGAEGVVAKDSQQLRDTGFSVTTAIEQGNPKVVIIDSATQWSPDLIVVGSHGRKGLDRFLMGSLAACSLLGTHRASRKLVRPRQLGPLPVIFRHL